MLAEFTFSYLLTFQSAQHWFSPFQWLITLHYLVLLCTQILCQLYSPHPLFCEQMRNSIIVYTCTFFCLGFMGWRVLTAHFMSVQSLFERMGNLLCASSHSFFPGTLQSVCYVPTEMLRKGILLVLRPLMIDVVDFRAATMKICEISDQKGFGDLWDLQSARHLLPYYSTQLHCRWRKKSS